MRHGTGADVAFLACDLLWHWRRSLLDHPYERRREELESLTLPKPAHVSTPFDDGEALFEQTREHGYEGVVAKRRASLRVPGLHLRVGRRGSLWSQRAICETPQLVVLGPGEELTVTDATPGTRFMLLAGQPYGETPVFNGPYVD